MFPVTPIAVRVSFIRVFDTYDELVSISFTIVLMPVTSAWISNAVSAAPLTAPPIAFL